VPAPVKNNPTEAKIIFGEAKVITTPIVHMAQAIITVFLLPQLSEKNEVMIYPKRAPK